MTVMYISSCARVCVFMSLCGVGVAADGEEAERLTTQKDIVTEGLLCVST